MLGIQSKASKYLLCHRIDYELMLSVSLYVQSKVGPKAPCAKHAYG